MDTHLERRMLSHLGYICNNGERDTNVKFWKNIKLNVARVFRGCGGVALVHLNYSIFNIVHKVRNQYAKAVQVLQYTNLVVLSRTFGQLL